MTVDDNWPRNNLSDDCLIFLMYFYGGGGLISKVVKSLILNPNNYMGSCLQWHKGK